MDQKYVDMLIKLSIIILIDNFSECLIFSDISIGLDDNLTIS